jgi:hypothetical protein
MTKRMLVGLGLAALIAVPLLAGPNGPAMGAGCCMSQTGVERTVTNLANGVRITLTATDPKVVETLQARTETCPKDGCADCPMHAEGVTRSVEKTANGVVITATSSDPAQVAKLQKHAASMTAGTCPRHKARAGCMKGGGPHGNCRHSGMAKPATS